MAAGSPIKAARRSLTSCPRISGSLDANARVSSMAPRKCSSVGGSSVMNKAHDAPAQGVRSTQRQRIADEIVDVFCIEIGSPVMARKYRLDESIENCLQRVSRRRSPRRAIMPDAMADLTEMRSSATMESRRHRVSVLLPRLSASARGSFSRQIDRHGLPRCTRRDQQCRTSRRY